MYKDIFQEYIFKVLTDISCKQIKNGNIIIFYLFVV